MTDEVQHDFFNKEMCFINGTLLCYSFILTQLNYNINLSSVCSQYYLICFSRVPKMLVHIGLYVKDKQFF